MKGLLEADFRDGVSKAEQECRLSRHLAEQLSGMIDAPLRLVDACIIMPRLSGPDLWTLAKREGGTARVRLAIDHSVVLAARLHRLNAMAIPELRVYDYADDPYLPVPSRLRDRLCDRPRTIVLTGLEVRNFKQACTDGPWKFFDPHTAVLGAPEDDFARYVLSLLMINWGRNANCRLWTQFDFRGLMQTYETARDASLDHQLLAYMLQRNIAWRRFEARCMARALPWFVRAAALAYEKLFFWQVRQWGSRYGL